MRFRNVTVSGQPGRYRVQLEGADPQHDVRDVSFDRIEILGSKLTADSDRVQMGKNSGEVRFGASPP